MQREGWGGEKDLGKMREGETMIKIYEFSIKKNTLVFICIPEPEFLVVVQGSLELLSLPPPF